MSVMTKKLQVLLSGIVFGSMVCFPASADDIEVFLGDSTKSAGNPNVVFILDTSGSMLSTLSAPNAYNVGTTYPTTAVPAGTTFATGFYYWSKDGSIPSDPTTDNKVAIANFHCDAATTVTHGNMLTTHGIFTDRALAWRSNNWRELNAHSLGAEDVECFTDNGAHGANGGGGSYVANGAAGPWGANTGQKIWENASTYYTFYTANFLNYSKHPPSDFPTRWQVMQNATDQLIRRSSNINFGLTVFGGGNGGFIHKEVTNVNVLSDRIALLNSVANLRPPGSITPLSESFHETFLYYTGDNILYGLDTASGTIGYQSVAASRATPTTYKSPLQECGKNYSILLTDGVPVFDDSSDAAIEALTGAACSDEPGLFSGHCLDDLAHYMDIARAYPGSNVPGEHRVQTYTIGFALNDPSAVALLKKTAKHSDVDTAADERNRRFFPANNSEQLISAFEQITTDASGEPSTFTAPTVAVDGLNQRLNRNFLYFTMFQPSTTPRWEGNLKKYRLVVNRGGPTYITDSSTTDPLPDVIANDGTIIPAANSFWNNIVDGNDVNRGGVRARLTNGHLNSRDVWSDISNNSSLSNSSNAISETNTNLTAAMLGAGTVAEKDDIAKWMRGVDVLDSDGDNDLTESRNSVGDPLHSQPVIVTYDLGGGVTKQVIFFSTNDGYLHAIDEETGNELFAYIPRELLSIQKTLFENSSLDRPYGLDGSVSIWIDDKDGDGVVDPATEKAYLYVGMRRGGRNYYALDITDAQNTTTNARLLWKIVDGDWIRGNGTVTAGTYSEMGQSWSQPLVRKVDVNGTERTVLVIGGGYDINQDSVTVTTVDTTGRAIYFIDALTGERVWWAGDVGSGADLEIAEMDYSIPSRLVAYDLDGDKMLDRMYVGDMGGQLWRFDVTNGKPLAELVDGGVIADLSGTDAEGARRFYEPPDVSFLVVPSGAFLAIAIGSGYRAHPRDVTVQDRLYMIRDHDIYAPPSNGTYVRLNENQLYNATSDDIDELNDPGNAISDLQGAEGWYINLDKAQGEKSLARPLIAQGVVIMTTYSPGAPTTANLCAPAAGQGTVYYLNITDATAAYDLHNPTPNSKLTKEDRKHKLKSGGIPASPYWITSLDEQGSGASQTTGVGVSDFSTDSPTLIRTYWYEQ